MFFLSFLILLTSGITLFIIWLFLFRRTKWINRNDKTILITGCDSGIGFELAKHFHQNGSVVLSTVLSKKSIGAVELASKLTSRFYLFELDLSKCTDESVKEIKKYLDKHNRDLHVLINNAGVCFMGEFDFCTFEQIEHQLKVNFLGLTFMTKHFLSYLIKSKGRIINVSSVNSLVPFPGLSVYSATKKAIEHFSESLQIELKKFDIKVVCLRLGDYAKLTNIMVNHKKIASQQFQKLSQEQKNFYGNYFHLYHENILEKYGLFSPKSWKSSSLFENFDEACFAIKPRNYIMSATLFYKLFIYFLYYVPKNFRDFLFNKFIDSQMKTLNRKHILKNTTLSSKEKS